MNGWISVNDALPMPGVSVLIYSPDWTDQPPPFAMADRDDEGHWWVDGKEEATDAVVTYWMLVEVPVNGGAQE